MRMEAKNRRHTTKFTSLWKSYFCVDDDDDGDDNDDDNDDDYGLREKKNDIKGILICWHL